MYCMFSMYVAMYLDFYRAHFKMSLLKIFTIMIIIGHHNDNDINDKR